MAVRRPSKAKEPRRVVVLVFTDFQVLDAMGPIEVFNVASRLLEAAGSRRSRFRTVH